MAKILTFLTNEDKTELEQQTGDNISTHDNSAFAHSDIREQLSRLSSEKVDVSAIAQNTGNDSEKIMSQAAITAAIESLTTLPYGGSKEWLENNGDTTQLYQIDGYVWAYIDGTGWTRSGTQFNVVSSESQMTNEGGAPYLLRSGNKGTVYSYTEASGDAGVPVYDELPETANEGDVVAVKPTEVKSTSEMTDSSKQYAMNGHIWVCEEVTVTVEAPNVLVPSTATLNQRLSGSSATVSANDSSKGSFVTDFIPVKDMDSITPYNVRLNWEIPLSGDNKIVYFNSSKARLGSTVFTTTGGTEQNTTISNGETVIDIKTMAANTSSAPSNWADVAYIRVQLFVKPIGTSLTSDDVTNLTISFDHESSTRTEKTWYDTGIVAGRKYKASLTTKEVPNFTNLADPTSSDWATGYRINSSGGLSEAEGFTATNFIPCSKNNTLRIAGIGSKFTSTSGSQRLQLVDASKTNIMIGYPTNSYSSSSTQSSFKELITYNNGVYEYNVGLLGGGSTTSKTVAYARIGYADTGINPSDVIITVNEEITYTTKTVVNWTDIGAYIEPTEAGWSATGETQNIIDSLSDTATNGTTAVYSADGYKYTYLSGADWMQTSKYSVPTLIVDGELSDTSTNAIENRVVKGAIDSIRIVTNSNTNEINALNTKIAKIETGSDTVIIPTFWQSAVDEAIAKIKALQVGRNCVTFPFFSDNHQRNGYAGILISHIMKECHIPYCFFGGDSISNGYIDSEETMIAQDKAFDAIMSYIPNGRFCRTVGNHDGFWNVSSATGDEYTYSRDKIYDLFLREESVAQNKHFGDDGTYYYVDDLASKTRFVVLNTNGIKNESGTVVGGTFDSTQLAWLQNTALYFTESGWAVVFISHQPISNHYHAGINNAEEVRTVIRNHINSTDANKADIVGWFSGHIHRDRIYTGAAVNTKDDTEGEAMGFTQVVITSDHTSIAYDDATKHTVASDDQSHAIDFVTINKSTRTVNLTRLGVGEDRSYTY